MTEGGVEAAWKVLPGNPRVCGFTHWLGETEGALSVGLLFSNCWD